MEKILKTRVISGRFRGKNLILPSLNITRSSKSIVKSSIFDTLGSDIIGKNFIEVFAGSGSIAIEALSRGSDTVYCIEKDRHSFKVLSDNFGSLKGVSSSEYVLFNGDAFKLLDEININSAIYYIDPPFDTRDGFSQIYDRVINMINSINREKIEYLIIEHNSDIVLSDKIDLEFLKHKKFGKTSLSYFTSY